MKYSLRHSLLLLLAACLFLTGCKKEVEQKKRILKVDIMLPTTPVKNQGASPLCWLYAMLGTIETDRLALGDSVNLSVDYLARCLVEEKARQSYFLPADSKPSLRGMAPDALVLLNRYGAMPYDTYKADGTPNYNVLMNKATQIAHASIALRTMDDGIVTLLDRSLGYLPPTVHLLGATYTPREFAHSVALPGSYRAYTSFSHVPFRQWTSLHLPDNIYGERFYNLPIQELTRLVRQSIAHRKAVCWEGDISGDGFNFAKAKADVDFPTDGRAQNHRQQAFEQRKLNDQHAMVLCGLAHTADGQRYFICKNSWGADNAMHGYMLMSERYFMARTIAVVMHR